MTQMLVELFDLEIDLASGLQQWQQTARWLKYEENTEGVDQNWGRPHVSFLPLATLHKLKDYVEDGLLLLDVEADSYNEVIDVIVNSLLSRKNVERATVTEVLETLKKKPMHVYDMVSPLRKMTTWRREERSNSASSSVQGEHALHTLVEEEPEQQQSFAYKTPVERKIGWRRGVQQSRKSTFRQKGSLGRKISRMVYDEDVEGEQLLDHMPVGTEAAQVFVGAIEALADAHFVMVRFKEAMEMTKIMGTVMPVRFLFFVVGPKLPDVDYHQLGRAVSTLMNDKIFGRAARVGGKDAIVRGMNAFIDTSVVLPPGDIDNKELVTFDEIKKALKTPKRINFQLWEEDDDSEKVKSTNQNEPMPSRPVSSAVRKRTRSNPLRRRGKLFYGLRRDVSMRLRDYISDFKDGFNFQCLTTIVFMFFACFAPAITFGGLMGTYTHYSMGISETLLAQSLCGIIWGLVSVQPLLIASATGPVLIFEASLYQFCHLLEVDFLTIRVWAGFWLMLFGLVTVMFEGSTLLKYVTRFTEDIFAALISVIFIAESVKFLIKTFHKHPVVNLNYYVTENEECSLDGDHFYDTNSTLSHTFGNSSLKSTCDAKHQPDTGLLTAILMISTFILAFVFKELRGSHYFGRRLRNFIGDFSVLFAIFIVAIIQIFVFPNSYIERLDMPASFGFTSDGAARGGRWKVFINPWLPSDKLWGYAFAALPAFLVYILLFVETEITQLLLKERGLKKGTGFHWDLLLVSVLAFVCGIFGLPWMCAAAVQSLAHAGALSVWNRHAPGEKATVNYVIEQRITTIGVSLLIGLCAFGGRFLSQLPYAVLFGVFLYLGVMNLNGVQLVDRVMLLVIPQKYFPDLPYCRKVSYWRMHAYTAVQLACLLLVYVAKHFKKTAFAFPFVLMLIGVYRLVGLKWIFTKDELQALDGHQEEEEEKTDREDEHAFKGPITHKVTVYQSPMILFD